MFIVGSLVFDILPFNNRPLRNNRLTITMLGATILKGYSMTVNQVRVVFSKCKPQGQANSSAHPDVTAPGQLAHQVLVFVVL